MHRAHKIRLYPTHEQEIHLRKACGVARFAYNWGLARWNELHAQDKEVSAYSLRRELNAVKREQFPWMLEVTKCSPMESLLNLGEAFKYFFSKTHGYPKFKKKGVKDSFTVSMDGGNFALSGSKVRLPKLGLVKSAEPLRWPQAKLLSLTIKRVADRWYAVVNVELPEQPQAEPSENQTDSVVGVDLGLRTFATLSTGEKVEHPRYLRTALPRLRRLGQALARKTAGSRNRHRAKNRLARKHASIANQRRHFLHKLTTDICKRFDTVVVEDLAVKNMGALPSLSRSIYDSCFSEFRQQISYKAERVVVADRFYPSSKLCSCCGFKLPTLSLNTRSWVCPQCGAVHDRDINAAVNLKHLGQTATAHGAILALSACGDLRECVSAKQEMCKT